MPNTCSSLTRLYDSLQRCSGQINPAGIQRRVYFIEKSKILVWPSGTHTPGIGEPASNATALDKQKAKSSYFGQFTLAADAVWNFIDCIDNKGELEIETQGNAPNRYFSNKFTVYFPNIGKAASIFMQECLNDDLVFVVQDRAGNYRVLGHPTLPTTTTPKGTSGEGYNGETMMSVEIEAVDYRPAPFLDNVSLRTLGNANVTTSIVSY